MPEGGRVPCLMDPPIMTIAYAGTIKLSEEKGKGRWKIKPHRLFFSLSFCGRKNNDDCFNTRRTVQVMQIEVAIRNNT